MKFASLVAKPDSMSNDEFASWFLGQHLPKFRESATMFQGCVVRTRTDPLGGQGLSGLGWTGPIPDPSEIGACDIVMETWLPSGEDFRREIMPGEERLREVGASFASYAVAPYLQKDPRLAEAGAAGRRPEVTFISTVKWQKGIDPEFAVGEWAQHTAIALRRQPILTKYEQNIVSEIMSWTHGYPIIDAYGDFAFDKKDDLVSKFRVSNEEIQDAGQFVGLSEVTFFGDAQTFRI